MQQRIWAALGGFPDIVQQVAGGLGIALATSQFSQRDEGREFFLGEIHGAGTGQGVVESLVREGMVGQCCRGLALEARGSDELALVALHLGQIPSTAGERLGRGRIAKPERQFGEVGVRQALALVISLLP